MDRVELLAFDLAFRRVIREPGGEGRREFSCQGLRRNLHFSYYVSAKLQTVYVLMAYQERFGEPRKDDLRDEKNLIDAIHAKEALHEDKPEI